MGKCIQFTYRRRFQSTRALDGTGKSVCCLHQIIPDRHGIVSLYRTLVLHTTYNYNRSEFYLRKQRFDTEKYYDMSETVDAFLGCVLLTRISMYPIKYPIRDLAAAGPLQSALQLGRNESRRHCCCRLVLHSPSMQHRAPSRTPVLACCLVLLSSSSS